MSKYSNKVARTITGWLHEADYQVDLAIQTLHRDVAHAACVCKPHDAYCPFFCLSPTETRAAPKSLEHLRRNLAAVHYEMRLSLTLVGDASRLETPLWQVPYILSSCCGGCLLTAEWDAQWAAVHVKAAEPISVTERLLAQLAGLRAVISHAPFVEAGTITAVMHLCKAVMDEFVNPGTETVLCMGDGAAIQAAEELVKDDTGLQ